MLNNLHLFQILTMNLKADTDIPTLYPTVGEFKDFNTYVAYIEKKALHKFGLVKVFE